MALSKRRFPKDLIELLSSGEAVAVVGSGPSVAAGFPSWVGLLQSLIGECEQHITPFEHREELEQLLISGHLPEVADACVGFLPKHIYRDFLQNTFSTKGKRPTALHRAILRLPFASVLTTNYDTLLEQAHARMHNKALAVPAYTQKNTSLLAGLASRQQFYFLKLHGHVDDPDTLVLTRADYDSLLHANPAYKLAVSTIFATKTVVFIGYGMRDPDLLLLLNEHVRAFNGYGRRHFAFVADAGQVWQSGLSNRLNVTAIPYSSKESHSELLTLLTKLGEDVEQCIRDRSDLAKIERAQLSAAQQVATILTCERQICDILGDHIELERARYLKLHAGAALSAEDGAFIDESICVGERKRTLEKEQQEAFIHSLKLQSLGELAAGVAHDFNNLLQVIIASNQLIEIDVDKSNVSRELVAAIGSAASRGMEITRQLLSFAKADSCTKEKIDVVDALVESRMLLSRSVVTQNPIVWKLPEKPCLVVIDRTRLHQLLFNLILNAADATTDTKGTIEVTVSCSDPRDDGALVRVPKNYRKEYVCLLVRDSGVGMSRDVLARVFEAFFTTKSNGTGLGLSIVHAVVEECDGAIAVESAVGKGTSFRIYFPTQSLGKWTNTDMMGEVGEPEIAHKRFVNRTIVVVDDEVGVCRAVALSIQRLGCSVVSFTVSSEAIRYIANLSNPCDCVFTDYIMPEISGVDVAKSVRRMRKGTPVIMMSGYASGDGEARKVGIAKVLRKPFGLVEIESELFRVLESGRGTSKRVHTNRPGNRKSA